MILNYAILSGEISSYIITVITKYSKSCLKPPLKNRQNKGLNDKW